MEGYPMVLVLVGRCENGLVQLIDQVVDAHLQTLKPVLVCVTELGRSRLNEVLHVGDVVEVSRGDVRVHSLFSLSHGGIRCILLQVAKVLVLRDLNGATPVFPVHGDHEVLEVVKGVHVPRPVLVRQLVAKLSFQVEMLV